MSTIFEVKLQDLKSNSRTKEVVFARQVAMYLAKILISDSLVTIAQSFGKTHSTILYACKTVEQRLQQDEMLQRKIQICRNHIDV